MISEETPQIPLADLVQIVVESVVGVLADPETEKKLRKARAVVETAQQTPEAKKPKGKRRADRGTCPECGNSYAITKDGTLRRHGEGNCFLRALCPAELIPAYLVVSLANVGDGEHDESGRGNHVQ